MTIEFPIKMASSRLSFEFTERDYLDVPLHSVCSEATTNQNFLDNEIEQSLNYDMCISFSRHDDLKQMLDSNRDNLKLEAMKRIIGVSFAFYL